ncbi:MAG: substrate-binding domain-containing protein, partial [Roseburia sp.]|nr:substrate-binding domain-containing protein [Roseburia sp.]
VRVGVVAQDATSESVVNRGLGFIDKFAELAAADGHTATVEGNERYINDSKVGKVDGADVIIDVKVPASVTSDASLADVNTLLGNSDIIALYGSNEHSANAIISAAENHSEIGTGEGQVVAAGFDSGSAQIEAVKNGVLLGSITQAPVAMGEILVETLYKAANGEAVADTDTGCQWYTAENIENPEIWDNLYGK